MTEDYFVFKSVPGTIPQFDFRGGTKCYSEMSSLSILQRLQYVHDHADVTLSSGKNSGKSLKRAQEYISRANKSNDVERMKNLNIALMNIPLDSKEQEFSDIKDKRDEVVDSLNLLCNAERCSNDRNISKKIKVVYKEGVGRHVIATEDIDVGEEIVSEAPGSAFLHHSHSLTNCHHCHVSVTRAVPCDTCSEVLFCSDTCRHVAKAYHDRECGHADIVPGIGTLAPVLRIVTSKSVEFFSQRKHYFDRYDKTSDDYEDEFDALFRLQAGCKKDSQYRVNKAAYSIYLVCLLKRMEYFANNDLTILEEEHLIVGRFLDHFLRVADDNCHEICELDQPRIIKDKSFDELFDGADSAVKVVGVGIFPTISLFNNCCDVNTFKYHQGNTETMLARRPIKAGEEVSDFYGEYYFQNNKFARKKNLGFPCGCVACQKNWPLLDNLPGFNMEDVEERYDWALQVSIIIFEFCN